MPSQTDLDQSGTSRQWVRTFMGPSIGWVNAPLQNVLPVTAVGTYFLDPSTSLVTVNVVGAVTIQLPPAADPIVPAGVQPGLFVNNPITVVDIGGHATATPITIQPAGGETIMGLASIQISVNYGGYTLVPNSVTHTWVSISP